MPADTKQKPFLVTNTQARAIHTCGLTLIPGKLTEIPAKHVDALKRSPAWNAKPPWIVEGAAVMPAPTILPIGKLDIDKARKLIAVESDLPTLTAWADTDNRPEVQEAIRARVTAL